MSSPRPYESLISLSATEALKRFRRGALSPLALVEDCLARIERENPAINAFAHLSPDAARAEARASEARWKAGTPRGPLDGLPVTLKDMTRTADMPTRLGSRTTPAEGLGEQDAPVAAHLREAGAVILGKTTTPEYGWKAVTDSPLTGVTRNPWNPRLTPGGSSGGAAAAAALNLGLLHQGSDAGGSIRIPAAFTGTVGIKPSFGWVPQWPASPMGTLSHLGPIARRVEDAVLMLEAMARPDARDGHLGNPRRPDWRTPPPPDLRGWRIALSLDLGYVEVAPDIAARVREAATRLRELGARVEEAAPGIACPLATFNTLWFAGASQLLDAWSEAQRRRLDPGLLDIARRGATLPLRDYLAACRARERLTAQLADFHRRFDLLVTPTLPLSPFAAGHDVPPDGPYQEWMEWTPFTYPFNLSQQPALSMPCGLDDRGLPVGLQLVGARFDDLRVLHAARLLEPRLPRSFPETACRAGNE
ncbi:amidase [Halomonas beimenensis]|uniref:Aspartyl-tRNA(Asn)/glutamyl-tRNA(Gln) amidotransferase subunit A n=1 Tax=Halomonas beimenensis TaxID=475662 RepID=A0A291PBU5_9GAMM|nr:amidase [Halomonas beimenensis]ATJ84360.1 aspartyl-tRNA(Asn)/glutamyl-tRNA(Gln) amidotransferase subunit A [Halomonas beimenensis]